MPQANILLKNIPTFPPGTTVGDVRDALQRKKNWDSVNYIYLVSAKGVLKGVVSMKELLRARATDTLDRIASKKVFFLHSGATPERAALFAVHKNIKSVPVVDRHGMLLGIVGADQILSTLQHSGIEDAVRYSGIHLEHRELLDVLKGRASLLIKRRFPWILIGLFGGFIASLFVSRYEAFLLETVELAFFIPAVVYIGSAFGAQTGALFLRAITIGEVPVRRFLVKEIIVGSVVGVTIGILSSALVMLLFREARVAAIIGLAMFATIVIAGPISMLLTVVIADRRKDPALGIGPLGTMIQDFVSLLLYFTIASVILSI